MAENLEKILLHDLKVTVQQIKDWQASRSKLFTQPSSQQWAIRRYCSITLVWRWSPVSNPSPKSRLRTLSIPGEQTAGALFSWRNFVSQIWRRKVGGEWSFVLVWRGLMEVLWGLIMRELIPLLRVFIQIKEGKGGQKDNEKRTECWFNRSSKSALHGLIHASDCHF